MRNSFTRRSFGLRKAGFWRELNRKLDSCTEKYPFLGAGELEEELEEIHKQAILSLDRIGIDVSEDKKKFGL